MSSSSNAYLGNQYQDKRKGLTETFVCVQRIRLSACDYNLARGVGSGIRDAFELCDVCSLWGAPLT